MPERKIGENKSKIDLSLHVLCIMLDHKLEKNQKLAMCSYYEAVK